MSNLFSDGDLVLGAEPLAKPVAAVPIDGAVRPAHGAEAKVVRPAQQKPVQSRHSVLDRHPQPTTVGQLADLVPKARDLLRRRTRPDEGATRLRRVAPPDRIAQKVERPSRDTAQPRLR